MKTQIIMNICAFSAHYIESPYLCLRVPLRLPLRPRLSRFDVKFIGFPMGLPSGFLYNFLAIGRIVFKGVPGFSFTSFLTRSDHAVIYIVG
jgi:hypothetical protein